MMSEAGRAVFLSYASQDAEAVRRIADALRAAGVEVWFDQNELVGGDAWDAKIRKQIAECALFVPIVSANTQARLEGYFRIEWKLAAQRTHAMADEKAFLLPVVLDDTRDGEARVPAEFKTVQWTRLRGGEGCGSFCERVRTLLNGQPQTAGTRHSTEVASPPSVVRRRAPVIWLAVAMIGAAATLFWLRGRDGGAAPAAGSGPAAAEIAAVRARIVPDRWQKEDFDAVAPLLDRIIGGNPDAADAWALRSIINTLQITRNYDSGTAHLAAGKQSADRSLRLAPGSPLGELALGFHLMGMVTRGGDPHAPRPLLDRALAALPRDPITRYIELISAWQCYDLPRTEQSAQAWLAAEPRATMPTWIMSQMQVVLRRPDEVERWAERALTDSSVTGIRAFYTIFEAKYYLRADLAGARAALDRVPASGRLVHRVVHGRWLLDMAEQRWDDALQGLSRLTDPFLFDRTYHGPRALLAGLAHQRAGRPDAAASQYREAERLLRERLAADAENDELRAELAVALAGLGRMTEARNELALVEPLLTGRVPSIYRGPQIVPVAQARAMMGDTERLNFWLRKLFAERSGVAFTPAALRLDPRFTGLLEAPETQALLREFAHLDQRAKPGAAASEANSARADKSVAVLAFENRSDDKRTEYFSDGISEELLNVLAKVPGLKVTARTSAFSFKGKNVPIPDIARQLGVAYVVEGSVSKAGDQVRISARLVKAADGFHVWGDTFTRDVKDSFAVQDEIAGLIARSLELKLGDELTPRREMKPEALDAYLTGRALAAKASLGDLRAAVAAFERAATLDPGFTAARVQQARAYIQLGRWGGLVPKEAWSKAKAALAPALAAEPDAPEVLVAHGWLLRTADWKWLEAERTFSRAIAARPNDVDVLASAAVLQIGIGKVDAAHDLARRALELDPLNPASQFDLGIIYRFTDRMPEAERQFRRALELSPHGQRYRTFLSIALSALGRVDEAEAMVRDEPDEFSREFALGLIAARRGDMAAVREYIRRIEDRRARVGDLADYNAYLASLYGAVGDFERGFAELELARTGRDPSVSWMKINTLLNVFRAQPRWPEFLRSIGLADEQLK